MLKGRKMYIMHYAIHPDNNRRVLVGLSELDVGRDLVEFTYVTTSDQEAKPIGYYLELT